MEDDYEDPDNWRDFTDEPDCEPDALEIVLNGAIVLLPWYLVVSKYHVSKPQVTPR